MWRVRLNDKAAKIEMTNNLHTSHVPIMPSPHDVRHVEHIQNAEYATEDYPSQTLERRAAQSNQAQRGVCAHCEQKCMYSG